MKNKKGFTIVELVIVIAVIAILAAVLIPTFTTVTANARASAAQSQAKNAQESVLGNTEGTMPENTLFAISNDNDSRAEYFFVIKDRKLDSAKVESLDGKAYPAGTDNTYNVFVTADRFSGELDATKLASIKTNVDGLLKDVLDYKYSGKTKESDTTNEGTWTAVNDAHNNDYVEAGAGSINPNPAATSDYAVWKYTAKDGTTVVTLNVYYNGDLADTCVVFLAN